MTDIFPIRRNHNNNNNVKMEEKPDLTMNDNNNNDSYNENNNSHQKSQTKEVCADLLEGIDWDDGFGENENNTLKQNENQIENIDFNDFNDFKNDNNINNNQCFIDDSFIDYLPLEIFPRFVCFVCVCVCVCVTNCGL